MQVWGVLKQDSILAENIFSLVIKGKKTYYYLRKNMVKKYAKYLKPGVKVVFEALEEQETHKDLAVYPIDTFYSITRRVKYRTIVYYDQFLIQKGIAKIVNRKKPVLFIDFEMNMQDYFPIEGFVQEIIEAGYLVCDYYGPVREVRHLYIKPTKFKKITKRTYNFLPFTKDTFENAVTFKDFYNDFLDLVKKYDPTIFVWGKSDITQFKKCMEINKIEDYDFNFVDLLQLHVNYFNYKEAPGLFNMWNKYHGVELEDQSHDALEDAEVTKDVFFEFKKLINNGEQHAKK